MTVRFSPGLPTLPLDAHSASASSLLNLTRLTLAAPDLATAIVPTLEHLIPEHPVSLRMFVHFR